MDSQNLVSGNGPLGEDDLRYALFRQVMQKSPDLISIVDRDYVYRMVNEAYLERYNMTEEQMVGTPAPEIFGQNVFESKIKPHLDRCLAGETINYQDWFIYADLGKRYMDVCYYPLPNDKDSTEHVAVVVRDITDSKRMEEALLESEKRYKRLIAEANEIIVTMDIETGKITSANSFAQKKLGYSEAEFLDMPSYLDLIHPDDRTALLSALKHYIADGARHPNFPFRGVRADGTCLDVEQNAAIIFDNDGNPKTVVAIAHDVTERKKIEEALKLSEERYHRILDASHDMISVVDENANLLFASKSVYENTGYTIEDIERIDGFDTIHADDRERIAQWFLRVLNGEPARGVEYRGIHKSGETRWVESNADLIYWDQGQKAVVNVLRDVTERKKMEEELRLSEERHRRIIDASHDMTLVLDAGAEILFANRAWHEDASYSLDDYNEIDIFDTIHPDDREKVKGWFERTLSGESARDVKYRALTKDGGMKWIEANADAINWPGAEKAVVVTARDVTERKRAEEALKESEERYRTLVDNSLTGIYVRRGNRFAFVNGRAAEISGYTRDELLEVPFLSFLHPDERESARKNAERRMAGEKLKKSTQYRTITKNGESRWIELFATRINYQGEPAVMTNFIDITDRKQAEDSLRESEERYRVHFENVSDVVYSIDRELRITSMSPSIKAALGYEPEEIVGRKIHELNILSPEDIERAIRNANLVMSGKRVDRTEYELIAKDGTKRMAEISASPLFKDGKIVAGIDVARDITERKRAEEALENSLSLLSATLESTADGILVTDNDGKIVSFNQKFMDLWRIPESIMATQENSRALEFVLDQLEDPEDFLKKVEMVHGRPEKESFDIISFKDGRVFERYSKPQMMGNDVVGLVMSYRDITERTRAEEALKESEEMYRSIFWEAPDIFYILDLETWSITDANKYALEALGYTPEMMGKIHIFDVIHPEDLERATDRLRDMVIKKDRMPHFPLRILTATGKVRHIEQSGVIFWDEEGRAKTFLGLAHDVTHRVERDEMIRKRNEKLAALYEVAKAANTTLDLKTSLDLMLEVVPRITNSATMAIFSFDEQSRQFEYLAHFGLSEEIIKGTDHVKPDEGIHGYLMKHKKPLLIRNIQEHAMPSRPSLVKKLDIESTIAAPLILENKVIGSLWVSRKPGAPYDQDDLDLIGAMANHIATAIANAGLYSRVRGRESRLQAILETSRDGIALITSDRRVIYRNSAMGEIFGYDETDDLSGIDTTSYFAPESLPVLANVRNRLFEGRDIFETIQFKGRKKNGSTFDAEARLGSFVEHGRRYDVAVIHDLTEQNRLRSQLEQSSKLAAIGELAAGVAHEINNPIATLDVQTGLMRDILDDEREKIEVSLSKQIEEYLDIVDDQVRRCQSVTGSLLSFGRTQKSSVESIELNRLLEKTVNLITSLSDKKPAIKLNLDECLPRFRGNPNRLEQVFVNLLSNAVKAIRSGGSINVATYLDPNENIRIEFEDTGPGIPSETQARIFDPFFTTDSASGTGLGLSISYFIIKEMNGSIEVESSPGKGATFIITLKSEGETGGKSRPCLMNR